MNKMLMVRAAALALTLVEPAVAADMPVESYKSAPFASRFTWTSCYVGAHLGGGFAQKNLTDPVQIVQDSFLGAGSTTGITTASPSPSGVVIGGQIGCNYQFAPSWVVGVEGAVSGSTMKGSRTIPLPLGNLGESESVSVRTDFIPSITGRLGYALDRVLLYAKGGVAWADDRYKVTGVFQGTPFSFEGSDARTGWTAGGGVEWAFSNHWSASLEYDYYQFGHRSTLISDSLNGFSGPIETKQSVQVVKAGLNFHMWASE